MKIVDLVCSAGRTGFYFDDQRAIKGGAGHDGVFYVGAPVTDGFSSVRQAGVLDIPFAPSRFNAGKMLPARDNDGAIRILEVGNLPFTKELIDFHREKIEERGKAEGRKPQFQMVIDDVYAISKGRLVGRPKK